MSLTILEELGGRGATGSFSGGGGGGGGGGGSIPARMADPVADGLIANTHSNYTNATTPYMYQKAGPYASPADAIAQSMKKLGARHMREVWGKNNALQRAAVAALHAANGGDVLFILGGNVPATAPVATDLAADITSHYGGGTASGGTVRWVSGYNEPDNAAAGVDWATPTKAAQKLLYPAINPLGIPVLTPPLAATIAAQGSKAAYAALGNQDPWADVLDIHCYPGGFEPPFDLPGHLSAARPTVMPATAPTIVSETGYENAMNFYGGNPPVPEDIAAIYGPRLIAEHAWLGLIGWAFYELYDERKADYATVHSTSGTTTRERRFGLIAWDDQTEPSFRPKPIAVAIGRVQALTADPGPAFTPTPLGATLGAVPADMKILLLTKRDGSHYLWLWRTTRLWTPPKNSGGVFTDGVRLTPSPATETVTLTLNDPGTVARYQPSVNATADQFGLPPTPVSSSSGIVFNVPVGNDLVILKIT